ncbi:MAG: hypothetical protein ACI8QF_002581 [Limisphaerales bacterium]|jgi:hypothetical protein
MILKITPCAEQRNMCRDLGLSIDPICVRAVRVVLDTGEVEVLFTNLLTAQKWPAELFGELYHCRWGVESEYRRWQSTLEIDRWSGKSVATVEQDFHACILTSNLAQIFANEADEEVQEQTEGRKHKYQVNRIRALGIMAGHIWKLLYCRKLQALVQKLIQRMTRNPGAIRPGRKFPRNFRFGPRVFSHPYKAMS